MNIIYTWVKSREILLGNRNEIHVWPLVWLWYEDYTHTHKREEATCYVPEQMLPQNIPKLSIVQTDSLKCTRIDFCYDFVCFCSINF